MTARTGVKATQRCANTHVCVGRVCRRAEAIDRICFKVLTKWRLIVAAAYMHS
eukprot:XP_001706876.1 Hypothetical protein GL50803_39600 [Giardia lamblia ATCC 50803]